MLSAVTMILVCVLLLHRFRDRFRLFGFLWRFLDTGSYYQEQFAKSKWSVSLAAVFGVASLAASVLIPSFTGPLVLVGLVLLLMCAFALSDWSLSWIERVLGRLVRSNETRRYSHAVLVITTVVFWNVLLPKTLDQWRLWVEIASLLLVFIAGVWASFQSVRHSLFDHFPERDEWLAGFVTSVLRTIVHHFATLLLLSLASVAYLVQLVPGALVPNGAKHITPLLLINYVVGKLTVSGSSLVSPTPGVGAGLDTIMSLLGAGFMVLAVASLFAVLPRAKPEKRKSTRGPTKASR